MRTLRITAAAGAFLIYGLLCFAAAFLGLA